MARRNSTDDAPVEAQGDLDVAEAAPVVDEPAADLPGGDFDVEAWVAAVYDYQHNGGPKPVRTYRVAPAEALHVDAAGHVTAVERGGEQAAEQAAEGAELEAADEESMR